MSSLRSKQYRQYKSFSLQQQNPCKNAQCPVNARCYSDFEHETYACVCIPGFTGNSCQTRKFSVCIEIDDSQRTFIFKEIEMYYFSIAPSSICSLLFSTIPQSEVVDQVGDHSKEGYRANLSWGSVN